METITLRRLTMKSKLNYGPDANSTVEKMIGAQRFRALRHLYYTVEWMDFTDDVKQAINITHPIAKPGISPEMERLNNEEMVARMRGKDAFKQKAHLDAQKRRSDREERRSNRLAESMSKGQLQAVNHGKAHINEREIE